MKCRTITTKTCLGCPNHYFDAGKGMCAKDHEPAHPETCKSSIERTIRIRVALNKNIRFESRIEP